MTMEALPQVCFLNRRVNPPTMPAPEGRKGYNRVSLHRDPDLEVAAARWIAGGESSLHGHGDSAACYCVISGVIEEERYFPHPDGSYHYERVRLEAGQRSDLPAGAFHKVKALTDSVTLHYYMPAPCDATEAVPAETLKLLIEAKARSLPQKLGERIHERPAAA